MCKTLINTAPRIQGGGAALQRRGPTPVHPWGGCGIFLLVKMSLEVFLATKILYRPDTDPIPSLYRPIPAYTDPLPTPYRLYTNPIPAYTDRIPTLYRPVADLIPTLYRPIPTPIQPYVRPKIHQDIQISILISTYTSRYPAYWDGGGSLGKLLRIPAGGTQLNVGAGVRARARARANAGALSRKIEIRKFEACSLKNIMRSMDIKRVVICPLNYNICSVCFLIILYYVFYDPLTDWYGVCIKPYKTYLENIGLKRRVGAPHFPRGGVYRPNKWDSPIYSTRIKMVYHGKQLCRISVFCSHPPSIPATSLTA